MSGPPFLSLPGVKFVLVGILSCILLVPTFLIWALIDERSQRADEVAQKISAGWGAEQIINGPYLAIPYQGPRDAQGLPGIQWALVMPEKLDIEANLKVEQRALSIYSLPVYGSKIGISGKFGKDALTYLHPDGPWTPDLSRAMLVMGISDMTGMRSDTAVSVNGGVAMPFEADLNGLVSRLSTPVRYADAEGGPFSGSGIHLAMPVDLVASGFAFRIDLSLNGSGLLAVAPAGQSTRLEVSSNWPHPGFDGRFLPEAKTIGEKGFDATWTIPALARGVSHVVRGNTLPLSDSVMEIKLVEPVKFYQTISRTLKYSIGFISLVFFAVFVLELKGRASIHWIQYALTGLSLVVFYALLLALAEHLGFAIAYLVSAGATTLLIGSYVGMLTKSRRSGVSLTGVIGAAYGVLYLIMREDDYALLAGALIAFLTIAATMFATRNVDWTGQHRTA